MRSCLIKFFQFLTVSSVTLFFLLSLFAVAPTQLSLAHYTPPPTTNLIRPWGDAPRRTSREEACLTQAIYYEAGLESRQGKEAVALVILNRVGQKRYASTICGVVHQYLIVDGHKICQFSYHCLPYYHPNPEKWREATAIARQSLKNIFNRDTLIRVRDARYFHATYVNPDWAKRKHYVTRIGGHIFYSEPEARK